MGAWARVPEGQEGYRQRMGTPHLALKHGPGAATSLWRGTKPASPCKISDQGGLVIEPLLHHDSTILRMDNQSAIATLETRQFQDMYRTKHAKPCKGI